MTLTPIHHLMPTKPTIATYNDSDIRPLFTQPFYQQTENRPTVLRAIDITGSKIADQQLFTAGIHTRVKNNNADNNHCKSDLLAYHGRDHQWHRSRELIPLGHYQTNQ